jgi:hypothetical protein
MIMKTAILTKDSSAIPKLELDCVDLISIFSIFVFFNV